MARNLLLITIIFIISTLFVITNASNNIDIKVFPAEGYTMKSYESLTQTIKLNLTRHENEKEDLSLELCLAHGNNGFASDNLQATGLSQVRNEILEELISDIADEVSGDSQDSLDDFFGQF